VDSMSERSRARGIIRGAGSSLKLDYLDKNDDIQVGDLIITTGLDGLFPKGLAIGEVNEVLKDSKGLFFEARVKPKVDLNRLEEVAVVLPGKTKP